MCLWKLKKAIILNLFGTGIARIKEEYTHSISKPAFYVSENRIRIVLPVTDKSKLKLSKDELLIYDLVKEQSELSRSEIDKKTGFDKSKTIRILNNLTAKNILEKEGKGVAVTYKLK